MLVVVWSWPIEGQGGVRALRGVSRAPGGEWAPAAGDLERLRGRAGDLEGLGGLSGIRKKFTVKFVVNFSEIFSDKRARAIARLGFASPFLLVPTPKSSKLDAPRPIAY